MTLALDVELYDFVKDHPEVKWSVIARRAMMDYARRLKVMDRIAKKSKLTEKDVEEIDKILKKEIFQYHEESS